MGLLSEVERADKSLVYGSISHSTHDRRFIKAFCERGWKVFYVRFDGESEPFDDDEFKNQVTLVEWFGTRVRVTEKNTSQAQDDFRKQLNFIKPKLVVAGPIPNVGFVAAKVSQVPVVLMSWASDLLVDVQISPLAKLNAQWAISNSAGIIVDSDVIADLAQQLSSTKINVLSVPWGIVIHDFAVGPLRRADGVFKIVSVRSFEKIYDIETLIRATAYLRHLAPEFKFHLTIVGQGTQADELRALAESLAIEGLITWMTPVQEKELRSLYLSHDLYVSTSTSDGSSISMLQALSVGQCVLVTNIKSNQEWITDNQNGWIFEVGNFKHLAKKILLISNSANQPQVRAAAPLVVHNRANWVKNKILITDFLDSISQT